MKQRVLCLARGSVTPGMTLAAPVCTQEGAVLLTEETVLDSEMLEGLIRHGVRVVLVRVPDLRSEETIAQEMAEVYARIEKIFRGPGSASRNELRSAVLGYRIESVQ